jgi:hypothetical protein
MNRITLGPPSIEAVTALVMSVTALVTALTALYHALKGDKADGPIGVGESQPGKID